MSYQTFSMPRPAGVRSKSRPRLSVAMLRLTHFLMRLLVTWLPLLAMVYLFKANLFPFILGSLYVHVISRRSPFRV